MIDVRPTGEKVWHTLVRGGVTVGFVATDLAYIDGIPTLVFWWQGQSDLPAPDATVPLEAQYLHELNWPQAKFMYELPIDDPRPNS